MRRLAWPFLICMTCMTAFSQDDGAGLRDALLKEDLAAIRASVDGAREKLAGKAGEPEVPDQFQRVPDDAKVLTHEEARQAWDASFRRLESLRFWEVGCDPAKLTAPLRAPASVIACMVAIHATGLDAEDKALNAARDAADFLMWAQAQAGAGCYPFPAARGTSKAKAMQVATRFLDQAERSGRLHEVVRNGWAFDDADDGGLQFDNAECGVAMLELYEHTHDQRYLESALKAADWALARTLVPNWNYNSFSVHLLAKAYSVTRQDRYLQGALKKALLGVMPGQLVDGVNAGRWIDPHNACPPYHYIMLAALAQLAAELPPSHADRPAVMASLMLGLKARNSEILSRGVMSKDKPMECLMLVTRLFAQDDSFLKESRTAEALDTLVRFASDQARKGRLPLGPRAWGEMLAWTTRS